MTTRYESAFILQPTLTEEEVKQKVELIKETLVKLKADIKAVDEIGMRELAYKIKKFEFDFLETLTLNHKDILETLRQGKLTEEVETTLRKVAGDMTLMYKQ